VSYAGKNESMGDAIWVIPVAFEAAMRDWESVFSHEGYFVFYPAHTAVRRKLVKKVGYSPHAIRMLPAARRTSATPFSEGKTTAWLITKGATCFTRSDEELDENERMLPIATVWNSSLPN